MQSKINKDIVKILEDLVWSRFTETKLNTKLSEIFGEEIKLYNASQGRIDSGEDDDELADWNFMFNIINEADEYELFADIYMLPTREKDGEEVVWYVTEVGYDFC